MDGKKIKFKKTEKKIALHSVAAIIKIIQGLEVEEVLTQTQSFKLFKLFMSAYNN